MPVSELLTPEEIAMFRNAPEDELVDLAIDLDVPVPEEIDIEGMLDAVVRNLASLGQREGLPFSRYDREDLAQLNEMERGAIANLNGVAPSKDADTQIAGLLKSGAKIYKMYRKTRPKSQIPLYLPSLLGPLARHLVSGND
jgi:hypothetical protein